MRKSYPYCVRDEDGKEWVGATVQTERATESLRWEGAWITETAKHPRLRQIRQLASALPSTVNDRGRPGIRGPHCRIYNCGQENEKKAWSNLRVTVGKDPDWLQKRKRQVYPESHIMFIKTKWFFLSKTPVLFLPPCTDDKSGAERSWTSHCGHCQFFFISSPCRLQHIRASLEQTSKIFCFPRMLSPSRICRLPP